MRRCRKVFAVYVDRVADEGAAAVTVFGVARLEAEELDTVGEAIEEVRHFEVCVGSRGIWVVAERVRSWDRS